VRDQVLNPYKTTCKITVLYTFIFIFLDSRLKGTDSALNNRNHSLPSICVTAATKYAFDTQFYGHIRKNRAAKHGKIRPEIIIIPTISAY
jgi:hypothetical protein